MYKNLIDEPAAKVVEQIFALRIGRFGPLQSVKCSEQKKEFTTMAYFDSIGRKPVIPLPRIRICDPAVLFKILLEFISIHAAL